MLTVGSRVRYRSGFLRSISCFTGPLPFARGTIESIKALSPECRIATIRWDADDEELPNKVNVANLERTTQ